MTRTERDSMGEMSLPDDVYYGIQTAKKMASIETGLSLSDFPEVSPFTHEQVLDTDYLP